MVITKKEIIRGLILSIISIAVNISFVYAQSKLNEHLNFYIENPSMVAENQEPVHVPLIPYSDSNNAMEADPDKSPYYLSLNGSWDFLYFKNPCLADERYLMPDMVYDKWKQIQVPGTWQMQGFDYNIYRNVPMEFSPYDPPHVPDDFNPTGVYLRNFDMPADWDGRKTRIHFEGVKSAYWLWLNGNYVGFDKGSMTSGEFDISSYVKEGHNQLIVKVVRWCDGSYLEDQDMWRFAGIYRDVYLYSVPQTRIQDLFVTTDLDEEYTNATLKLKCRLRNDFRAQVENLQINASLFDKHGNEFVTFQKSIKSIGEYDGLEIEMIKEIKNPDKWSAEKPSLYTLLLELSDKDKNIIYITEEKIGFREIEIKNRQLLINGVPILMKGVNRHEHDPRMGRTMTRALIEEDMKLMKLLNINAIRTSHYPNDPIFYDLADQYGFYICNEVNAECHYGEKYLAGLPGWEDAFMDRTERYLQRDKNHPSVIMWSMGNECGLAPVHYKMAEYVKRSDPTRPVYHQTNDPNGDAPFADIIGTRYPSPAMLDAIADTASRPVILGEYAHAVGNSMGHFNEYWEKFHKYPVLQGGYIWDWVNQGLYEPLRITPDASNYDHEVVVMGRPELVDGRNGQAFGLSGLDDFLEVTPHEILNITGDQLTIEAWIFPRGYTGSNAIITKGDHSFSLDQISKDSICFAIYTKEGRYHSELKTEVKAYVTQNWNNSWHHVAGIYDSKTIKLYLDGNEVGVKDVTGNIERTIHPVTIGKNHERDAENQPGFISNSIFDDIRIYRKAVPPENLGYFSPASHDAEDLILWLFLDEIKDRNQEFLNYGATPSHSATMDGIIFSDRTFQPESFQAKISHAPVLFEIKEPFNNEVLIKNKFHFSNLDEYILRWYLLQDTMRLQGGFLKENIAAQDEKDVILPINNIEYLPGAEYRLVLSLELDKDTWWAEKGHEITFKEFLIPNKFESPSPDLPVQEALSYETGRDKLSILGRDFSYVMDKNQGTIINITYQNENLILQGPQLNVFRPWIVNEISHWTRAEFDDWYEWGLDSLIHKVEDMEIAEINPSRIEVSFRVLSTSFIDRTIQFLNLYCFTFHGSGDVIFEHTVIPNIEFPARRPRDDIHWIQKVGLQFTLNELFTSVTWYGKGPFETYPDRKDGAKTGIFREEFKDVNMPYIIPQDFGNKTDVRWLIIQKDKGKGLMIISDNTCNFSVNPYRNLGDAWYPYQLKKSSGVTLNVDYIVSGVGGTPITVRQPYRTYPMKYHYKLRLRPVDIQLDKPIEIGRERF